VITQILPALIGSTCGKLMLSGILETQVEMVQAGLHDCGVDDFEVVQDGEWVALIV
jgi:ribosomal protein L11 methylase PrmA